MTKSAETLLREYRAEQAKTEHDGPAERWRKPVRPVAVEDDPRTMTYDGNVLRAGYNATFDAATIERFRQGYACLRCWEPQQTSFPDACPLCSYSMNELQRKDFAEEFEGDKWVGPSTGLGEEYDRMLDNGQRKRHKPGSSILLPGRDF